jgi:outer membrane protein assembly factor BamB
MQLAARRRDGIRSRVSGMRRGALLAGIVVYMGMARGAVLTVVADDDSPPTAGFTVPKADTKTIDTLDDLDRYIGKKAWELAFKAASGIDAQGKGMVPGGGEDGGQKGFLFPIGRRVSESLLRLSPEGRDAYRLFNDANAKVLWEKLQGAKSPNNGVPVDEMTVLRKIVDQYFLTSVGDLAADRLGDALLEQGNATGALGMWDAVMEKYPDPHVSTVMVQVKRAAALAMLHRREELEQLAGIIKATDAGQKVTVGGQEVDAADFAASLLAEATTDPATTMAATIPGGGESGNVLVKEGETPSWQIRVTTTATLEQMESQVQNWVGNIHFTGSTPPACADGKRVYVNWLGCTYAADLETGKMLWRTEKFSDVVSNPTMFPQYGVNPDHFAVNCGEGKVFTLTADQMVMQQREGGFGLECLDGETGKSLWKGSGALGAVLTPPVIVDGVGYLISVKDREQLQCVMIDPATGKVTGGVGGGAIPLGKPQASQSVYNNGQLYAMPVMVFRGGMLYVATNNGALLAVDLKEKRLAWAFQNDTKWIDTSRNYYEQTPRTFETPCALLEDGTDLYIKDSAAPGLYAIEPEDPKLEWRRTVSSEETVAGIVNGTAILLGHSVSGLDLKTRKLLWSTKIPVMTGLIQALVEPGHIYVATQRGIYDIDPANGDVLRIYRGADKGSPGGRLLVSGNRLICVTDAAVTAYPVERAAAN